MLEVASGLRSEVEAAKRQLLLWSESDAGRPRGTGQWTRKEILGHLVDSAANNHQRFVRAQLVDGLSWPGYEQNAWVSIHRYRDRPWVELVELWAALNRQIAAVVESIAPEKRLTPCTIGDQGPKSLEWWVQDYVRHLRHHIAQIQSD
jgi:hypothetical protein